MRPGPVLVGVDASAAARAAVVWAAAEAALAATELLILHAPEYLPAPSVSVAAEVQLRAADDTGLMVLEAAAELAQACEPAIVVRTLLSHSEPGQALVDLSAEARLVVLGSPGAPLGELSLLGSKRLRLSVHAHAPVLLVGQRAAFDYPRRLERVVVGASDTPAGRAAASVAAEFAALRGIGLELLAFHPEPESAEQELQRERLTTRLSHEHPGLQLRSRAVVGDPSLLLPRLSGEHSLLVVGCRHSDDRWSSRVGPVATSVMHRSRGPVVLVNETHHRRGA